MKTNMHKVLILFLLGFVFSFQQVRAQELLHVFEGYTGEFYTDYFENIYLFDNHALVKIGDDGQKRYTFDPGYRMKPSVVDVSNPLEIYLLYSGLNRVVVLDNTLSVIAEHRLSAAGFIDVWLICRSATEGFWMLDAADLKLQQLNNKLEVRAQSDFLFRRTGTQVKPLQLVEENRQVYLNNPTDGILVFDIYGNFLQTLNIVNVENFQVKDGVLYYLSGGKFFSKHLASSQLNEVNLPSGLSGNITKAQMQNNKLYLVDGEGLKIFKY